MNVFIDTNIYLTFYHFTNDDLEELKKLIVAIKSKRITLFITDQVVDEYKRNREVKIADALKRLNEQKLPQQFPQFCKDYEEYQLLMRHLRASEEAKQQLLDRLTQDIKGKSLGADKIINELFDLATRITSNDQIIARAKNRYEVGNPPGKNGSIGDAINWISLLDTIPYEAPLYFIARDKDYFSAIDDTTLSEYLTEEWERQKSSIVTLYTSLTEFFNQHFPEIKLASEFEKRLAISKLVNSCNFETTHVAIRKLKRYPDFTIKEINEIIDACINNNQIGLIIKDEDVETFILNLIKGKRDILDGDKIDQLNKMRQQWEDARENLSF